jgi:hypothetical protein
VNRITAILSAKPGELSGLFSGGRPIKVRAGGFAFAHTGTFFIPSEIRTVLGGYLKFVKGGSGSEILFWQIIKMLDAYGDPALALEMTADELMTVWLGCGDRYPGRSAPFDGLTVFLWNARALLAMSLPRQKKSGRAGEKAGRASWLKGPGKAVFTSEAPGEGRWNALPVPGIAEARVSGRGVTLKVGYIERCSK